MHFQLHVSERIRESREAELAPSYKTALNAFICVLLS